MKDWLENIERLLIEEQCHTVSDGKAIAGLLELINRDEARKPTMTGAYKRHCPACGETVYCAVHIFCPQCGQRLKWK